MQLTSILNIVLSTSLASSVPLIKRHTPQILTDISMIGSEASTLTNDVTSYNRSSSQTEPLLQHFEDLKNSISTTTSDVEAAGTFTEDNSTSISSAVTDVTSSVITLLVDLMNKVTSHPPSHTRA
jgi:phosphate uptake regulator